MTLLVTPGMGIGPEVTARALVAEPPDTPTVLIGEGDAVGAALDAEGIRWRRADTISEAISGVNVLVPHATEPIPVAAVRLAATACLEGRAAAMVTGPIHKQRLIEQGFAHMGHTDLLGAVCGVDPVMAFVGGQLRVALVTTHIPLSAVPDAIRIHRVAHVVRTAGSALRDDLGLSAPRISVCGVNPHAGEGGVLGPEDEREIAPACHILREEGWDVRGPMSAEAAFMDMRANRTDLVVAMYHDQGLAPLKVVDFGRCVNWTLGLPIIRTSVDHGTADDLVGTGRADPGSMVAALQLAKQIVAQRQT